MLAKIINKFSNYLNRPNFKYEKKYNYDQNTSLILENLRRDLKKITKINSDNYMDYLDKNISYKKREELKNKIISILKSNLNNDKSKKSFIDENEQNSLKDLKINGFAKTNYLDFSEEEVREINTHFRNKKKFPGHIISNTKKSSLKNLKKNPYYTFEPSDILSCPVIQRKIFNEKFINFIENFFEFIPTCITLNLYSQKNKLNKFDYLPQFFHRDYHDLKLLTFFVFLSDTNKENGSHCYIKHSHDYEIFKQNLNKDVRDRVSRENYNLLSFFELDKNSYGHEKKLNILNSNFEYLYGEKGTSFMTNNYGLHRAIEPQKNERIIFWLSFGMYNNQNIKRLPLRIQSSKLNLLPIKNYNKFKYIYRNYIKFNK